MQSHLFFMFKRFNPGLVSWDDIVVGYDFSFLEPPEIQAWVLEMGYEGEAVNALLELEGARLLDFEAHLWKACAEQRGKTARPGNLRWMAAQDRWRMALLKDALAMDLTPAALAKTIEVIYERVGCPEDMIGLFNPAAPWTGKAPTADLPAIGAFISRIDPQGTPTVALTA